MEQIINSFNGKTIVVTGASGFIGNRLIELLVTHSTCKVRAIVRNYGSAIRLARHPVEIILGDVLDKESIRKAFDGTDFVFHCAYGNKGSEDIRHEVNLTGTKNVLELSKENTISAFLFLSTVAVYGNVMGGTLTENTPVTNGVDEYGKSKLAAEKLVIAFGKQQNLPVVVLQPTGVYGPWAQSYGIRLWNIFQTKSYVLEAQTRGIANLVYVDDLIQAMLKAILSDKAFGNTYLIDGLDHVEWRTFFSSFGEMIGEDCVVTLMPDEISELKKLEDKKNTFLALCGRSITVNKTEIRKLRKFTVIDYLLKGISVLVSKKFEQQLLSKPIEKLTSVKKELVFMDKEAREFYASNARISIEKASQDFDYRPEFTFESGFKIQKEWFRWFSGRNSNP